MSDKFAAIAEQAWGTRRARPDQTDMERRIEMARLLPLWPNERDDLSVAGRQHIVRKLERALRSERQRGRAGHWAYDVARHAALVRSWRAERLALRAHTRRLEFAECLLDQRRQLTETVK